MVDLDAGELEKEFLGKDVVLGGDGQCDSPGFNAKNLCYFLMEVESNYFLTLKSWIIRGMLA